MRKFSAFWAQIIAGSFLFFIGYIATTSVYANTPLQAIFRLDKNNPDKTFDATITIKNTSANNISNWRLGFSSISYIQQVRNGQITNPVGEFFIISPNNKLLPAQSEVSLHIQGPGALEHINYAPRGYFLIVTDLAGKESTIEIEAQETKLLPWKPAPGADEFTRNIRNTQTSIEGNPVQPSITLDESLIVPLPAELIRQSGEFVLQKNTKLLIDKTSYDAKAAAYFFAQSISSSTGFQLTPAITSENDFPQNAIIFTKNKTDPKWGKEGYYLQVDSNRIIIRANESAGFFYAIQSLRQLLPPQIFAKKVSDTRWRIPALTIQDYPRFSYRGLHLDVSRHFVPKEQVKRLLDLMALHKLNTFHWHLSDDEGWRVEIKQYPSLTAIGAWRGYGRELQPAFGSGGKIYGGYYTQDDIREVVNYAKERKITIIPEIDIPGHSRALIKSLPDKLIDPTDKSQYTSAQGYHDNVLSPCLDSTFEVINNIFTELAALFPGDTIHVGGDEVPGGAWMKAPICKQKFGEKTTHELQNYFMQRVQTIVQSKNKKMAGWEEVIDGGNTDSSTLVYSWTGETAGYKAAERGYPVVMMPGQYLYFDMGYSVDAEEPGLFWANAADTFKAYSYSPIPASWPISIAKQIRGVEAALWSENIDSQDVLDYLAFPRLAALSEVAWTPAKRRNWLNFSERVGKLYLPKLDAYGVKYRLSLPGINLDAIKKGLLDANIEFLGLTMRYSIGSEPTTQSPIYSAPVSGVSEGVMMRSFDTTGRGGRVAGG